MPPVGPSLAILPKRENPKLVSPSSSTVEIFRDEFRLDASFDFKINVHVLLE
jgi:hypothetical protein